MSTAILRQRLATLVQGLGIVFAIQKLWIWGRTAKSKAQAKFLPLDASKWEGLSSPVPYAGWVTSQSQEYDLAQAAIEGHLPTDLRGSYYRVGPGLFERGNLRRTLLIDADGMVRRFQFSGSSVRFQNKHVRTRKFTEEESAKTFLFPTFSMLSPDARNNSALNIQNQASVTVIENGGRVFVFDEFQMPYELNARTLETMGPHRFAPRKPDLKLFAHYKRDPKTNDLVLLTRKDGIQPELSVVIVDQNNRFISESDRIKIPTGYGAYFHDWSLTENYYVFLLHPSTLELSDLREAISGNVPIAAAMRFKEKMHTGILVVSRSDASKQFLIEADAVHCWHTVNAYEQDGEIVFDFMGSRASVPLLDAKSPFSQIMRGELNPSEKARDWISFRRFRIDATKYTLIEDRILNENALYELPTVAPSRLGKPYRYAYAFRSAHHAILGSAITKMDVLTGREEFFDFGEGNFVGEPMFVPRRRGGTQEDFGYLLAEVYESLTKTTYLAVLRADAITDGPICKIRLPFHLPFGFHGSWNG